MCSSGKSEQKRGDHAPVGPPPGEASWEVLPKEGNTATIKVVRSDTKGCAILVLDVFAFAGTYKGSVVVSGSMGEARWQWPSDWEFTVDDRGALAGSLAFTTVQSAGSLGDVEISANWTFTGQVWEDGMLSASGLSELSAKHAYGDSSVTNGVTLEGEIVDDTFTGTIRAEDGETYEAKATRQ